MSIADEEKRIFDELKETNPSIVTDGVIDEREYLAARYKIAYILKEVNGGEGWDLRDVVRAGNRVQTWNSIARWTEGILSWEKDFLWSDMEKDNEARRKTQLKKIAVINLKKTSGGYTAENELVHKAAVDNASVIKRQLDLYSPDIIICCGTESAFVDSCYADAEPEWKSTARGVWYFMDGERIIISFVHPEARVRDAFLFYALTDAAKEILSNAQ
ncbi:MAG: hypothetical protein LUC19_03440 [Oscillospiraceae bacterium]|nr:hypothetical protein [Oscillospiraceae bacterium]